MGRRVGVSPTAATGMVPSRSKSVRAKPTYGRWEMGDGRWELGAPVARGVGGVGHVFIRYIGEARPFLSV